MHLLKKNSGKAFLGLVLQHEGVNSRNWVPVLALRGEQAGSSHGVRVGWVWGSAGGELRRCAHPFGGVGSRGHAPYPAFAPNTALWPWVFCASDSFLFIICPHCA